MICLNKDNPEIKKWFNSVGQEETYKQFITHNYKLPKYNTFVIKNSLGGLTKIERDNLLNQYLKLENYPIETIEKLRKMLPVTEAAFWENTFYFAESTNKLQVNEEAFHAIFQTLTSSDQRKVLFSIAEKLLENRIKKNNLSKTIIFDEYRAQIKKAGKKLTEQQLTEYVLEEELAKEWVNWITYDNDIIRESNYKEIWGNKDADFVSKIMETLKEFFNNLKEMVGVYNKNTTYLNNFFKKIKEGDNRLSSIVDENNRHEFPSLSAIQITPFTDNKEQFILNSVEQNNHYNRILSILLQLKENRFSSENIIADAIDIYNEEILSKFEENSDSADLYHTLAPYKFKGQIKRNPEYQLFFNDVERKFKRLEDAIAILDENLEKEEDEVGGVVSEQSDTSNQVDRMASLPAKVKLLISAVEIHDTNDLPITVKRQVLNDAGELIDNSFQVVPRRMADHTKVYSALIRASTNTVGEKERLRKLVIFAQDTELNTDTNAFLNSFLSKIFVKTTKSGYTVEVSSTKDLNLLKKQIAEDNITNFEISDTNYYKLVMKAFDLWTRKNLILKVSKEGFSTSFDPNTTNVRNRQLDQWNTSWETKNKRTKTLQFAKARRAIDDPIFKDSDNEGFKKENFDESLNALKEVFKFYEIKVSNNFLKFIVADAYDKAGIKLNNDYLNIFTTQFFTEEEFDLDLTGIASSIKHINSNNLDLDSVSPFYETDDASDISSHAKTIAYGNSFFDESVLAATFLNAENKTIYAHQLQTYVLKFGNYIVKNSLKYKEFVDKLVFSNRYNKFVFNNNFLHNFYNNELTDKEKTRLTSFSYAGLALHEGDVGGNIGKEIKAVVNEISPEDAVVFQMNALLHKSIIIQRKNKEKEIEEDLISAPFYLGHNETSNTHSFFAGKWMTSFKDRFGQKRSLYDLQNKKVGLGSVALARNSVEQQIERIEEFNKELDKFILSQINIKGAKSAKLSLTEENWREAGYTGTGIVKGFHTGKIPVIKVNNKWIVDSKKIDEDSAPRALIINKNLNGYLTNRNAVYDFIFNKSEEDNIEAKTNFDLGLDKDIQETLQKTIEQSLEIFKDKKNKQFLDQVFLGEKKLPTAQYTNIADRLGFLKYDSKLKAKDIFEHNVSLFMLNSMFNREQHQRILHGDQALTNKNDSLDVLKRNKGEGAQVSSAHTELKDDYLGVGTFTEMKVVQMVEADDKSVKNFDISGVSNNAVNSDDGQSFRSVEHTMHYMHGISKLTAHIAASLDKMLSGRDFSDKETNELIKAHSFVTVEKSRAYGPMIDMKHAEAILYKNFTAKKIQIEKSDLSSHYSNFAEIVLTQNGNSYRSVPVNGATEEITIEYDHLKYDSFESAERVKDFKLFKWVPISKELDDKRKLLEGWRYNKETNSWTFNEENKIGIISPISAHKRFKQDIWNGDISSFDNYHVQIYPTLDYGRQVENAPHSGMLDPTQQLEILTSNLPDIISTIDPHTGETIQYSKGEYISKFFEHLADRDKMSAEEMVKSLLNQDKLDYELLYSVIRNSLLDTGGDTQLAEFFATYANGEPIINGNLPLIKQKLEQHLFATLSRDVLAHKVPGDAFAMISPRGLMFLKRLTKETINGVEFYSWLSVSKGSDEFNNNYYSATTISKGKTYNGHSLLNNGPAENNTLSEELKSLWRDDAPVYFFDELRHLKPRIINGVIENYYSEAVIGKKDSRYNQEQRFIQGVRIPSQDKSTSANIEIVDELDAVLGNTVSIAKEIQDLSGADYDIDKMYIQFYEGYWTKLGFKKYENSLNDYVEYIFTKNKVLKDKLTRTYENDPVLIAINKETQELLAEQKALQAEFKDFKERRKTVDELSVEIKVHEKELKALGLPLIDITNYSDYSKRLAELELLKKLPDSAEKTSKIRLAEYGISLQESSMSDFLDKKENGTIEKLAKLEQLKIFLEKTKKEFNKEEKELDPKKLKIKVNKNRLNTIRSEKLEQKELLKKKVLQSVSLPYDENTFENTFGKTGFKAIVNNKMLDMKKVLLTANIAAYSNPTSVETLKKYFSGKENTDLLGVSTKEMEELVNKQVDYPINSPLFDVYYKERAVAGKIGIGTTVTGNATWLQLERSETFINPKYTVNIEINSTDSVNYYSFETLTKKIFEEKQRLTSEHNSEIITASTDEAKEGVLAQYNLIGELLSVFTTGQALGMHPQILLLLVNHKGLQKLAKESLKNPLQESKKSLLDSISEILKEMSTSTDVEESSISILDLQKGISDEDHMYIDALAAAYKLLKINAANKDLAKVIKLKRGFGATYQEYLETFKAIKRLKLETPVNLLNNKDAFPDITGNNIHDVYFHKNADGVLTPGLNINASGFEQTKNYLQHTLPLLNSVIEKVLLEGSKNYKEIFNFVNSSINTPDFKKQDLTIALNTALLGSLASNNENYKNDLTVEMLIGKNSIPNQFIQFLSGEKGEELSKEPLLKKLTPKLGYLVSLKKLKKLAKNKNKTDDELMERALDVTKLDSIIINQFVKMDPEVQSSLIDNFVRLKGFNTGQKTDLQLWIDSLIKYYIVKDGMRYNPVSISKVLPVSEFKPVSAEYDSFMKDSTNGIDVDFLKEDILERLLRDVRNSDLIAEFDDFDEDNDLISFARKDNTLGSIPVRSSNTDSVLTINTLPNKDGEFEPVPKYRRLGNRIFKHLVTNPGFVKTSYQEGANATTLKYNKNVFVEIPTVGSYDYHASISNVNIVVNKEEFLETLINIRNAAARLRKAKGTDEQVRVNNKVANLLAKQYLKSIKVLVHHNQKLITGKEYIDQEIAASQENKEEEEEIIKESEINYREFTPEKITTLKPNEIFVFGSNAEGAHGKGAAALASRGIDPVTKKKIHNGFGAIEGQAEGLQGQSFVIITKKNWRVEKSSTLVEIANNIYKFVAFASQNLDKKFYVTKIGSALAGYTVEEIKNVWKEVNDVWEHDMFDNIPDNIILPKEYEMRPNLTKIEVIRPGVILNNNDPLTKNEQLELFDYLKPYLETQGKKTNKGKNAPIMIGLNLRWDYKKNNLDKQEVNVGKNLAGTTTSYAYYDLSIDGKPLGPITGRFVELISKVSTIDISKYDGAIINLYSNDSFISNHSDLEESIEAVNDPVVVVNIGGEGNIIIGTNQTKIEKTIVPGGSYSFGVGGQNRKIMHSTYPADTKGFLPEIYINQENQTFKQGEYRISITMRRVMPYSTQDEVLTSSNEINSYSHNLEFALTNPTHTSPTGFDWKREWSADQKMWRDYLSEGIMYKGVKYKDVEEAYQKNKVNFTKKDLFNQEAKTTFDLMVDLITTKLNTYPKLVEGIISKGGLSYLEKATHQPTKNNSFWETKGENGFMRALIEAFKNITEPQSTNTSSLNYGEVSLNSYIQNTGDNTIVNLENLDQFSNFDKKCI